MAGAFFFAKTGIGLFMLKPGGTQRRPGNRDEAFFPENDEMTATANRSGHFFRNR